jgi:hypothetical protein
MLTIIIPVLNEEKLISNGLFIQNSVLDDVNIPINLFMEDVIHSDSLRMKY